MKLTVVVQAGGESRRMGTNKALLPFLGQPLIQRVVERLKPVADEMIITSNQPGDYAFLNLPVHPDIMPGYGALGGLLTALTVSTSPVTAVVACDMPFVSAELLMYQMQVFQRGQWDAVVPKGKGGFEPLHAIYRTAICRQAVAQAIKLGEKKMIAWFPKVKIYTIEQAEWCSFDPQGRIFWNVNTPQELQSAEAAAYADIG
ncbi:MAG: molybdenum cofactor guanylyltransferase [Chloroflexota bacterium]|nr:MAG: putative molybdenum cofactor guanylyltransferase [Bellilinea sp.]